jgi:hydrogenase maturation protease
MRSEAAGAGRVLVIGYGNPLRGDDGIGWNAANALAETVQDDRVRIVACTQLTPELAESMSRADRVIFIDASLSLAAGQLHVGRLTADDRTEELWTHHLDPRTLLLCAQILYGESPEVVLITMGGASFDCRDELSPAVREQFPVLLARIRKEVTEAGETSHLGHS